MAPEWTLTISVYHGAGMDLDDKTEFNTALNQLVGEWRDRALWFLREDYYPQTDIERGQVLDYIDRRADVRTYQRVARLRKCLSHRSNATSAG
jgi:hypothetical protein